MICLCVVCFFPPGCTALRWQSRSSSNQRVAVSIPGSPSPVEASLNKLLTLWMAVTLVRECVCMVELSIIGIGSTVSPLMSIWPLAQQPVVKVLHHCTIYHTICALYFFLHVMQFMSIFIQQYFTKHVLCVFSIAI